MVYKMLIAEDEVIELDYLTNLVKTRVLRLGRCLLLLPGRRR